MGVTQEFKGIYLREPEIINMLQGGDMRKISLIIVHCSDSDKTEHDNVETIRMWHWLRGFKTIGYHNVITKSGTIWPGRPLQMIGAHCEGHNSQSIGICITGQKDFQEKQFESAVNLIQGYLKEFGLTPADVFPHNHFNKQKTCPNFDWSTFIKRVEEKFYGDKIAGTEAGPRQGSTTQISQDDLGPVYEQPDLGLYTGQDIDLPEST